MASAETDRLLVRAAESFNARDFDAAIATAEQVLQVLPGNQDATQILDKARQKKNAQPQFEVARQRAIAALDGHRMSEAKAALDKMRSLDPEHPAVALLDRRLAAPAPSAPEVGESTNPGLSLVDEPPPVAPPPRPAPPPPPPPPLHDAGGLGDLSLDSFEDSSAAVVPPPDMGGNPATGPLALSGNDFSDRFSGGAGAPNLWSEAPADQGGLGDLSLDASPEPSYAPEAADPVFHRGPEPAAMAPEPPSQQQEIDSLIQRGDEAAQAGNRQQAIEVWSRIFLIDINNSEAVGRIEKARKEMSEGNKRVAEGLKRGREAFESGDFTGAREAFLEVLALDENDATSRSYLDRIESELARPSSGLDLSRKTPESDILVGGDGGRGRAGARGGAGRSRAEEEGEGAAPEGSDGPQVPDGARAALLLAIAVGGYFFMRPGRGGAPAPGAVRRRSVARARDRALQATASSTRRSPSSSRSRRSIPTTRAPRRCSRP